jgi:hypothetical protein
MEIQINGSSLLSLRALQQQWRWADGDKQGCLMQVARFAGSEMTAIMDDHGGFELMYLHFITGGFKTMEEAKAAGPQFARLCLQTMTELVYDHYASPAETQARCRALVTTHEEKKQRAVQEESERFNRTYDENARRRGQYDKE